MTATNHEHKATTNVFKLTLIQIPFLARLTGNAPFKHDKIIEARSFSMVTIVLYF